MIDLYEYENNLLKAGYNYIAGTDEAGRGPMAGPLVAAAVILDPHNKIEGLNDSKKLSAKKREALYKEILAKALDVAVCFVSVLEVDKLNVYQASRHAMEEAIKSLGLKPDYILSDAMNIDVTVPFINIIKGDSKSASIAAASIIAKVQRDLYMLELEEEYPSFSFKSHKGYVTKKHLLELEINGITPEHRKSFAPVQKAKYSK